MNLRTIRLELARNPEFPDGSSSHGYEFVAPLRADDHIDVEAWRERRQECRVWRFWQGEADEFGHLRHTRGGAWTFHYDIEGDPDEDEPGFRFESHPFKEGEYVSIREHDGSLRTFKIVAVRDGAPARTG
jgi:hypothetical protein